MFSHYLFGYDRRSEIISFLVNSRSSTSLLITSLNKILKLVWPHLSPEGLLSRPRQGGGPLLWTKEEAIDDFTGKSIGRAIPIGTKGAARNVAQRARHTGEDISAVTGHAAYGETPLGRQINVAIGGNPGAIDIFITGVVQAYI